MFASSQFSKRWFKLNSTLGQLSYFKDSSETVQKGAIYLRDIKEIQYSVIKDAPIYSIDLVSSGK
jgi:hypothetical protein